MKGENLLRSRGAKPNSLFIKITLLKGDLKMIKDCEVSMGRIITGHKKSYYTIRIQNRKENIWFLLYFLSPMMLSGLIIDRIITRKTMLLHSCLIEYGDFSRNIHDFLKTDTRSLNGL